MAVALSTGVSIVVVFKLAAVIVVRVSCFATAVVVIASDTFNGVLFGAAVTTGWFLVRMLVVVATLAVVVFAAKETATAC